MKNTLVLSFFVVFGAFALLASRDRADEPDTGDSAVPVGTRANSESTTTGEDSTKPIDFAHQVLPILWENCSKCHSGSKTEGDLRMDNRKTLIASGVLIPGDVAGSDLYERITSKDPDERMPPGGKTLTAEQTSIIKRWIEEGAKWEEGITLRSTFRTAPLAPRTPELPPIQAGRENPIDRIVDLHLATTKVTRPEPLSDERFIRRIYLDLIGLLPGTEKVKAFCDDSDPNKREKLVDEVLANKIAYADHWFTFWNDLLRNDFAGTGYIDGGRKQISEWLYQSLKNNKPYDQFVQELVHPDSASEGFLRGIKWRGNVNASQTVELQFSQNVGQVFLGLNLKCASCHDSFVGASTLADAYGIAAMVSDKPLEIYRCDKPTGKTAAIQFLYPELGTVDPNLPPDGRLAQMSELLTSDKNGRFARTMVNRLWQRMMGRGIVSPVDEMDNVPFSQDLLDYLAADFVEHKYDLKRTMALIAKSAIYQTQSTPVLESDAQGEGFVFKGPIAKRLTAEQFMDALWQITGAYPKQPAFRAGYRGGAPVRASLLVSNGIERTLGRPGRDQVVSTRPDDLTTLVALELSNGEDFADLLDKGAIKILTEHADWKQEEAIDWLYETLLSRTPSEEETRIAKEILGDQLEAESFADLLWTVLMLPEFQYLQ